MQQQRLGDINVARFSATQPPPAALAGGCAHTARAAQHRVAGQFSGCGTLRQQQSIARRYAREQLPAAAIALGAASGAAGARGTALERQRAAAAAAAAAAGSPRPAGAARAGRAWGRHRRAIFASRALSTAGRRARGQPLGRAAGRGRGGHERGGAAGRRCRPGRWVRESGSPAGEDGLRRSGRSGPGPRRCRCRRCHGCGAAARAARAAEPRSPARRAGALQMARPRSRRRPMPPAVPTAVGRSRDDARLAVRPQSLGKAVRTSSSARKPSGNSLGENHGQNVLSKYSFTDE